MKYFSPIFVWYTVAFLHIILTLNVEEVRTQRVQNARNSHFCYDKGLEGYRLKSEILKTIKAIAKVLCVVSCVDNPCCRSVNFKRNSPNEGNGNCELLHNVNDESSNRLEKDKLYEHIHLLEPQKEYMPNCCKVCNGSEIRKYKSGMCYCTPTEEEAKCKGTKLDLLLVVDGSGSVQEENFAKIKEFINRLNKKFDVGPDKTRIALVQFGEPEMTRIEFNLGDKSTLDEVEKGVANMTYLGSHGTYTGDALRRARKTVFNNDDGDRSDAPNILILFTDGQATDQGGKNVQVEEAQKLKDDGVTIITVGMGKKATIREFRSELMEMASKATGTNDALEFEADFENLDSISNALVKETCSV